MSKVLQERLHTRRVPSPEDAALLNLLVAAGHMRDRFDEICAEHGLTGAQYNVLRILRGGPDGGTARCEVAERMVDRSPDVTRLEDRLEKQGLVERFRCEEDRRLSLACVTAKGLELLDRIDPAMERAGRAFGERLGEADCRELSRICECIYGPEKA
ncbi:MAG: MarR family winged helix-turn-helix transcriptional regulator [Thermoanaerobaculia bacterium]